MKLLRTIRLDASDTFVFDSAAEPGEWAVSGGFMFADCDPATLTGKARAAFRNGFLGVASFGWSTLVQVVDASEADRAAAVEQLAQSFLARLGAPDPAAAREAAEAEIDFAASLSEHPPGTLVALHRSSEGDAIRETFRTLRPREGLRPARVFTFVEVEDDAGDEEGETILLVDLARGEQP
ncbi:MAG: hypothetical protein IRZ09_13660 [Variibacter sp.]|nr:hypothetical protein [Variibacter sp.]